MTIVGEDMSDIPESAGRKSASAQRASLWAIVAGPFNRSIYLRFQYVFALALFGLALMAAVTLVSGSMLLNTFEDSVSDAQFDMVDLHEIQDSLYETERLMARYAIEGDRSAPIEFKQH